MGYKLNVLGKPFDLVGGGGDFVPISGGTMTGLLTVSVPTATTEALILKTTDDDSTKNLLEVQDSGGSVLSVIDESGNVGIGTTSPTQALDVVGKIHFANAGDAGGVTLREKSDGSALEIRNTYDSIYSSILGSYFSAESGSLGVPGFNFGTTSGDYNTGMRRINSDKLSIVTGGADRMTIDNSGSVGIGTTSPGAKLQIDTGATTTIGQIIKAAASQTANLTEWQDSGGGVLTSVGPSGNMGIGTPVNSAIKTSIYSQPSPGATTVKILGDNVETTASISALLINARALQASASTANTTGLTMKATHQSDYNTGDLTGGFFQVIGAAGKTTKPVRMYAGNFAIDIEDMVMGSSDAITLNVVTPAVDTGSANDTWGMKINEGTYGAGSVTTQYGIEVADMDNATNNYAIYTGAGDVRFGDDVLIEASSASNVPLTLKAVASQTANLQEWQDSNGNVLSLIDKNGSMAIQTDSPVYGSAGGLDISSGEYSLIIGAENASSARTDATSKFGRIYGVHYTNAEEPVTLLVASSSATNNSVAFGGSSSVGNAVTLLQFYTAENNTTTTGTERTRINKFGYLSHAGIATIGQPVGTTPAGTLEVVSVAANSKTIIAKGAPSQTANLQEWQDSSGNVLGLVDERGIPTFDAGTGLTNVFIGDNAGNVAATGTSNIGIGPRALDALTEGLANIAIGKDALGKITTPNSNVAIGSGALFENITGTSNMAVGNSALNSNTGNSNAAIGALALWKQTTGNDNVGIGHNAGRYNVTGDNNTLIGTDAGYGVEANSYSNNTFIGWESGVDITTGSNNIFIGNTSGNKQTTNSNLLIIDNQARADIATELTNSILYGVMGATPGVQTLRLNASTTITHDAPATEMLIVKGAASQSANLTEWQDSGGNVLGLVDERGVPTFHMNTGVTNIFIGDNAGNKDTTANDLFGLGTNSLKSVTSGQDNTGVGTRTLEFVTDGTQNTAIGTNVLRYNTGSYNVGIGAGAMTGASGQSTGGTNIAIGRIAGNNITTGLRNTMIGYGVASTLTEGNRNIFFGYTTGDSATTGDDNILIGYDIQLPAVNTSDYLQIGDYLTGDLTSGNLVGASLQIVPGVTTDIGLIIKATASQTANLQEWQDSGGNVLQAITAGGGRIKNTTRVTTTYTILTTDDVVFCNTDAGAYTVTLPPGAEGQTFRIINSGSSANLLTIAPNGAEHLLGANSNFTLNDAESLVISYNATDGYY